MSTKKLEPWYTLEEIAYVMKLDYETTLKLVKKSIPYHQVAGQYRIYDANYREFIEDNLIFPQGDRKHRIHHYLGKNAIWTREEQMVTVQELAYYLHVDYRTAFQAMQYYIPHIYVKGRPRMYLSDVNNYVDAHQN